MGELIDIEEFRDREIRRLEREFHATMDEFDALSASGQHAMAGKTLAKVKAIREKLDKHRLRRLKRQAVATGFKYKPDVTFNGGRFDFGWKKT